MDTTTKPTHTQGEWKFATQPEGHSNIYVKNHKGLSAYKLATVESENISEATANADRIVKCVNMHDELILALKNFVSWANIKDGSPSQTLRDISIELIKEAEK